MFNIISSEYYNFIISTIYYEEIRACMNTLKKCNEGIFFEVIKPPSRESPNPIYC